jgi:hypothetical protein
MKVLTPGTIQDRRNCELLSSVTEVILKWMKELKNLYLDLIFKFKKHLHVSPVEIQGIKTKLNHWKIHLKESFASLSA